MSTAQGKSFLQNGAVSASKVHAVVHIHENAQTRKSSRKHDGGTLAFSTTQFVERSIF